MSEDGGLSESLNMYLDTVENAPVLVPKDVTEELGLPADLQAEHIFIHKTANYENYIVVQSDRIVAYTPEIEDDEPLLTLELEEGEKVYDITSVGNTLIISTSKGLHYVLYQNRVYSMLGNGLPFPYISFERTDIQTIKDISASADTYEGMGMGSDNSNWFLQLGGTLYLPSEEAWNANGDKVGGHTGEFKNCLDALWKEINTKKEEFEKDGYLFSPIWFRYEIDMYGSPISSMPILIPSTVAETLQAQITGRAAKSWELDQSEGGGGWYMSRSTHESISLTTPLEKYKVRAKLQSWSDIEQWKDILSSIRVYMSYPVNWGISKLSTSLNDRSESYTKVPAGGDESPNNEYYTSSGTVTFKPDTEYLENLLQASSQTFLIMDIAIFNKQKTDFSDEYKKLVNGEVLDVKKFLSTEVILGGQPMLTGDDMKHYTQSSKDLSVYNNKLILHNVAQQIDYDYNTLNSYDKEEGTGGSEPNKNIEFNVTYLLRGYAEDKVIKKRFVYAENTLAREKIYAFQIFPDSRAYKMIVDATIQTISVGQTGTQESRVRKCGEFDMFPHPYLDCAYYYGGIVNELVDLCVLDSVEEYVPNNIDDLENNLFVSEINKPFVFPNEGRHTLQSKVVGIAVATTALSQGQFGQFPLYVFTEDGIWAMETASDGSFVSQKPLSREVCVNPDSICSIDNAVVFVTAKGVMMIQGSQVMNISPYMNGRHYIPNESAVNLIKNQEGFEQLESAIVDEEPFMTFMKKTKVTYDHVGQRLIFITEDEAYQYIYKIDTQTWHKVAFNGFDLIAPLNSYPDCLVQGEGESLIEKLYIEIPQPNPYQGSIEVVVAYFKHIASIDITEKQAEMFLKGEYGFDVRRIDQVKLQDLIDALTANALSVVLVSEHDTNTKIYSLGTILDVDPEAKDAPKAAKGILITRPFDLGEPDVFKTITDVRIRGQFPKGAVKFILQASNDWVNWVTISTLRGRAWKLFRIFVLADLEPTDRISWIDVQYETKFTNKLR